MNDVQSLIDRQLGLPCRYGYDSVVRRLVVRETEWWHGLGAAPADDPPIFACRFAEAPAHHHMLALANEDGRVAIQDTSKTGSEGSLESFQCHNNAVFDLAWMPGAMNFVTVSGDHTACLWDVGGGEARRVAVFLAHSRSVKTAAFRPTANAPAFATGGRDGAVLVWDARAGAGPSGAVGGMVRPDNALSRCHSNATPRATSSHGKRPRLDAPRPVSITGLVFQDEHTLISCGEFDGNIKVWDLRKNYSAYTREPLPKHSIPYCGSSTRNGYTNLIVDSSGVRLYASCMDNVIYCFNVATYSARPERRYRGHENATFYIKTALSPDGRYLVSGSSDTRAYVWAVGGGAGAGGGRPLVRLAGHRAEVTCAAWGRAPTPTLVTCSDDARHMLWRVGREDELAEPLALCGRAEPEPRAASASPPPSPSPCRSPLGHTPHSGRRRTLPRPSRPAKRLRTGPPPRSKRCLAALLSAARDDEPTCKRPRADDAPPPPAPSAGCKRPCPPDADVPVKRCCGAEEAGFRTPTKAEESRRQALSPRSPNAPPPAPPLSPPWARVRAFTAALPDYVRDGEAPHLRLMSPPKRKPDTPDWLTRLTREKRGLADPPAPLPRSPKENTPPPRGSTSERTPRATAKNRTLLNYFLVAPKEKN